MELKGLAALPSAYEMAMREYLDRVGGRSRVPADSSMPSQLQVQQFQGTPQGYNVGGTLDLGQGLSMEGRNTKLGPGINDWRAVLKYLGQF